MTQKLILLFILIPVFGLLAQEKTMALLDLKGENISASDTEIITSRLRSELAATNKFNIIEREKMNELLNEQGIQISGLVSDERIVKAGKLLGVQEMTAGTVGKIGNLYTISLRLIDVETGKIIKTSSADNSRGIEAFLTESLQTASRRLAGLESANLNNNYQPRPKEGMKIARPRKNQPRAAGQRKQKNFENFRQRLNNAPPEIKQAGKELFITDKKIREINKSPRKTLKQRKELIRLKERRKELIGKLRDWEEKK